MADVDGNLILGLFPAGESSGYISRDMSPAHYGKVGNRVYIDIGSGGGGESEIKVTILSPPDGSTLGPNDLITLEVEPVSSLIQIVAAYEGVLRPEVVWAGAGPGPNFSETTKTNGATSSVFVIKRDGGWIAAPILTAYITT